MKSKEEISRTISSLLLSDNVPLIREALAEEARESFVTEKMICLLVSMGESADTIARKLSVPVSRVEAVIATPQNVDTIIKMQATICPEPLERLKKLTNLAIDVKVKLLMTAKSETVRDNVASDIIDRAMGKAIQITESRNINFDVKDIGALDKALEAQMARLNKLEATQKALRAIPVEATAA